MAYVYDDSTGTYQWQDDPPAGQSPDQQTPPEQLGSFHVPINSTAPNGQQDLSYWQSRHDEGLPGAPGVDDMFDTQTGQLKPGWKRTAKGYEYVGSTVAPPTVNDPYDPKNYPPNPRTLTGGNGSGLRSLSSLWPDWNPPNFNAPAPFSYADFTAPTEAEAEAEPGYAFAASQGRKQVEATKAAQGVYKSGQTLKDIYAWASEYAKQNYGGAFDRKLQTYGTNRNNAAENYMTNYGVSRDVFDRNYNSYLGGFDSQKRKAELDFARDWDQYASDTDIKKTIYQGGQA